VTPNTVLDIAAGACADSTGTVMITLGAFTKSTAGAWAAGSGGNGMGGGLTIAASTWYHVFACINAGVSDVFFDTSPTGAHAPLGTTSFRRIRSFKTDGAAHIVPDVQNGDRIDAASGTIEYSGTPGHTTADVLTLVGVPAGLAVQALLTGTSQDGTASNGAIYLSSLAQPDFAAGIPNITGVLGTAGAAFFGFNAIVMTNASGQIRRRVGSITMATTIMSNGYIDNRGRFA
jgi:hypothetical protein